MKITSTTRVVTKTEAQTHLRRDPLRAQPFWGTIPVAWTTTSSHDPTATTRTIAPHNQEALPSTTSAATLTE